MRVQVCAAVALAREGVWDLMQRRVAVCVEAVSMNSFTVEQVLFLLAHTIGVAPGLIPRASDSPELRPIPASNPAH